MTLSGLVRDIAAAETEEDKHFVRDQIVVKLRQHLRHADEDELAEIGDLTGQEGKALSNAVRTMPPADIVALFARPGLVTRIEALKARKANGPGIFISTHADELVSIDDVFEGVSSPEDYITAFERFVRENQNLVPALVAATQRPRELTRVDLKELAKLLDEKGYSEAKLRRAYGRVRSADIAAHIIGFIRQAAVGDPLVPYKTRVENAVRRIEASRAWTSKQRQWLQRIGRALLEQPVGDPTILDEPAFRQKGGFEAVDRDFDHALGEVLREINAEIWGRPAA